MYKDVIETLKHISQDMDRWRRSNEIPGNRLIACSDELKEVVEILKAEPTNVTRQLTIRLAVALSKPVENLNLSVRTYNALKRWGISSIGDLYEARLDGQLPKVRNLGNKSMLEIEKYLDEYVDSVIQEAHHEEH
jgi:DNA-directed RNA polymerase alpha subunit